MIEIMLMGGKGWEDWLVFYLGQTRTTSINAAPSTDLISVPSNDAYAQYSDPEWEYDRRTTNYGSWSTWSTVTSTQTREQSGTSKPSTSLVTVPSNTTTAQYQTPDWTHTSTRYTYGTWGSWSTVNAGGTQESTRNATPITSVSTPNDTTTTQYQNGRWVSDGTRVASEYTGWSNWVQRSGTGNLTTVPNFFNNTDTRQFTDVYYVPGDNTTYYKDRTRSLGDVTYYKFKSVYDRRTRSRTTWRTWTATYQRRTRGIASYTYHWVAKVLRRLRKS